MSILLKNIKVWSLLMATVFSATCFADAGSTWPTSVLNFFDGAITAKTTWLSQPSTSKNASLKVELFDSSNHPYDIDPSLVSVGLFMPAMPDMGVEQQNIVSMNDASGNPIPGVIVAADVSFSMRGTWEIQVTLPDPKNQNLSEMKKMNLIIK